MHTQPAPYDDLTTDELRTLADDAENAWDYCPGVVYPMWDVYALRAEIKRREAAATDLCAGLEALIAEAA